MCNNLHFSICLTIKTFKIAILSCKIELYNERDVIICLGVYGIARLAHARNPRTI